MTDYPAQDMSSTAGATLTERSGTASADTVPAGSLCIWRNTGAGTHVVTVTTNNTVDGLAVADRTVSIPAGGLMGHRIKAEWGDVNGRCAVAIDGTASEVKYYVVGGV